MGSRLTRRGVLAGMLASAGQAALAEAPLTSPLPVPRGGAPRIIVRDRTDELLANASLGGLVGFAVADAASGEILEARHGDVPLPPASTMKSITALYALDRLGNSHRFTTSVLALGPVVAGRIEGDVALISDGDPTLDTDRLVDLAARLAEAGITEATGRLLVWGGALPSLDRIEPGQPDHVGYNPAIGGLNLNFNRVHFSWERVETGYDIDMLARGEAAAPQTNVARMRIVDRRLPVYEHRTFKGVDYWTVAKGALGKEGSRWLPVRNPALYAGDVFRALAREKGVRLPMVEVVETRPEGQVIADVSGPVLPTLLRGMLKYSTNLTAEVTGLAASVANGVPVGDLTASGSRMAGWAVEKHGIRRPTFRDHSGLGYGSTATALDMVRILQRGPAAGLPGLLKPVNLALDKANPAPPGVSVVAKTGTLNFVSALTGYIRTGTGDDRIFAILTADTARRDAVPLEQRDRAEGGRSWARRSRLLQKQLLRNWAARLV